MSSSNRAVQRVSERRLIAVAGSRDCEQVIYTARILARKAGFSVQEEFLLAAAASELATNIVHYASPGSIELTIVETGAPRRCGMEIFAADTGPGIENLDLAMQDHYSTRKNSLGSGLPSVRRIMDEFEIDSGPDRGTTVRARKWTR